jgi:hypothetical protein
MSQPRALLPGTIGGRNAPSQRTALACGRRVMGGWCFVPLAGTPWKRYRGHPLLRECPR